MTTAVESVAIPNVAIAVASNMNTPNLQRRALRSPRKRNTVSSRWAFSTVPRSRSVNQYVTIPLVSAGSSVAAASPVGHYEPDRDDRPEHRGDSGEDEEDLD